jgi:transcriptional regulator with XRE-family HTH domain
MYGSKIRMIRNSRGLSQEDVAKRLGTTQNAYSKMENNHTKINDSVVQALADIFGVTAEDIKSPEPVIVNFHNSPQSSNSVNGEINYHISEKLLEQLTRQLSEKDNQLAEKDKQIEKLIALLAEKKK